MNYDKLQLSFILLLVMSIIQCLTAALILHNALITLFSVIAIILCISGLFFTSHKINDIKKK